MGWGVGWGADEVLRVTLVQAGANPAIVDMEERTAIDYSESAGFAEITHAMQKVITPFS